MTATPKPITYAERDAAIREICDGYDRAVKGLSALDYLKVSTAYDSQAFTQIRALMSQPVEPPTSKWEDPRVQTVYEILCADEMPKNKEEHWEGWTARRIVDALCRPVEPVSEWQSIATAPKDGSDFIAVIHGYEPAMCHWQADMEAWATIRIEDYDDMDDFYCQLRNSKYEPTHYMLLPTPPKEKP